MKIAIRSSIKHRWTTFKLRYKVARRVGFRKFLSLKKISFCSFPDTPKTHRFPLLENGYALEKILHICNIKVMPFSPWKQYDYVLNWQDSTTDFVDTHKYILHAYSHSGRNLISTNFINAKANDITKKKMAELNKKIFGYDLDIDPTVYEGKVVKKSDFNGLHDGEVIDCPIDVNHVKSDFVYNICINNIDNQNQATDFRVIFMNGVLDFFYEKKRPIHSRFDTHKSSTKVRNIADEFTIDEIEKITLFCNRLGANYGEMDILRDRDSNKIFIVDFAKTPFGPLHGFSNFQRNIATEELAVNFINKIIVKTIS